MNPSALLSAVRALFEVDTGCGYALAGASRQPLDFKNDRNVAVPA